MVNINKLKGKIVENGYNLVEFPQIIGMSKDRWYRRISNAGKEFTIKEATIISQKLLLSANDIMDIFFNDFIA